MSYQSFPWQVGDSKSFEKLVSLYLPVLKGKTVLDVGCNAGFFCGWAAFQQAGKVKGIDHNPSFIEQARQWFEGCSFYCMSWDDLGLEKYDLILCLSAIHYAKDQKALIDLLMSRLNPGGVLVLEMGIAPGGADEFVKVDRSIDSRYFPTHSKLRSMLSEYTFKAIGQSVPQAGDPLPRYIYHVQQAKPLAILFMDGHYAGKTSVALKIINPAIPRLSGDAVYAKIANKELQVPSSLSELVQFDAETKNIDSAMLTNNICKAGLLPQLALIYADLAGKKDFILDTFVPVDYQLELCEIMEKAGYFIVDVNLYPERQDPWPRTRPPHSQYSAYMDYLSELASIDEAEYLAANPDVAQAVAAGKIPSGQVHYWAFGKREKRKTRPE